jgi:hypothetical protein
MKAVADTLQVARSNWWSGRSEAGAGRDLNIARPPTPSCWRAKGRIVRVELMVMLIVAAAVVIGVLGAG